MHHRSQWKRITPATILATILIALVAPRPVLGASALPKCALEQDWRRYDGTHFILYTNVPAEEGAEHAKRLDRFAQVFYRREPSLQRAGASRVVAFGLAGKGCYDSFRTIFEGKPVESVGTFIQGPLGSYFQYLVSGRPEDIRTMYHEYMHALANDQMRGAPPCLSEGFAEFYSTFEILRDEAHFGHPIKPYLWFLGQQELLTMDELFGVGYGRDYFRGERRDVFYAQSWALVHYLASAGQREKLREFIEALRAEVPAEQAFATSFPGMSWAAMPATLKQHVASSELEHFILPMGEAVVDRPIGMRPATRVEALTALGDLLRQQGRTRPEGAQAFYIAALEQAPRYGAALAGLGAINQARGFPKEALGLFARAARDSTNDASTWVRIGNGYVADATRDSAAFALRSEPVRESIRMARRSVEQALRLEPGSRDAGLLFVRTLDGDSAAAQGAIDLLRASHLALPEEPEIAEALVGACLDRDEVDEAEAVVARTFGRGSSRTGGDWSRSRIVAWKMAQVSKLLAAQKLDEAVVRLREIREATTDRELIAHIDAQLGRIASHTAGNADVDRFNQAVALANKGKLDEAIGIFDELGRSASDPALLLEARERAERIRKFRGERNAASRR